MKEHEIRPKEVFDEYLRLSKLDIKKYFNEKNEFVEIKCPACFQPEGEFHFAKHGFQYKKCKNCYTLFVSPRPNSKMISSFYRNSTSSRYWAEHFYPITAEARREKIYRPRAKEVSQLVKSDVKDFDKNIIDVGAGYGIFLEEILKLNTFDKVIGIEPNKDLARTCREKKIETIEKSIEEIKTDELKGSVVCSFEVFEHVFDPDKFIKDLKKVTKKNGLILLTTLSYSGFDLLTLGKESNSISPPHHINFFTVEGFREILKKNNLEEVSITTPGKLDVDLVINKANEGKLDKLSEFVDYLINKRGEDAHDRFQKFLIESNLSSHIWVLARKLDD